MFMSETYVYTGVCVGICSARILMENPAPSYLVSHMLFKSHVYNVYQMDSFSIKIRAGMSTEPEHLLLR